MLSKVLRGSLCALAGFVLSAAVPRFELRDTMGVAHTAAEWSGYKAVVLFFVTTDCPIGNSYVPEMNRIREEYGKRGVLFWAVQAETSTDATAVARYAREFHYQFPVLIDPRQVLVEMSGARITPQAAVMSPDGRLYYLGRIDNRVEDFGKQRPQATERDLKDALDAVLGGKPVAHPTTKSIGCAINRR